MGTVHSIHRLSVARLGHDDLVLGDPEDQERTARPAAHCLCNVVNFVVGACLYLIMYLIVPACGPRHAFGVAFPLGNPRRIAGSGPIERLA